MDGIQCEEVTCMLSKVPQNLSEWRLENGLVGWLFHFCH